MSLFLETQTEDGEPVKYRLGFKHEPLSEIKFKQNRLTKKGKIVEVDVVVRKTRTGEAIISQVAADGTRTDISTAQAVCQPEDNYDKAYARISSFAKALALSGLPKDVKGKLIVSFVTRTGTFNYHELLSITDILFELEVHNIIAEEAHKAELKKQTSQSIRLAHAKAKANLADVI